MLSYWSLNLAAACSSSNSEGSVSSRTTVNLHSPIQVTLNERNPWDVNEATFPFLASKPPAGKCVCVCVCVWTCWCWVQTCELWTRETWQQTGTLSIRILRLVEWKRCSQNKLIEYTVYYIGAVTFILLNLAWVPYKWEALDRLANRTYLTWIKHANTYWIHCAA